MSDHFQQLLLRAVQKSPPPAASESDDVSSKLLAAMPVEYVRLSRGGMSREASESVPERIEGIIVPHSIVSVPGKLVKVHLLEADIRYMSGLFNNSECLYYLNKLSENKNASKWDKLGKGRYVAQWSDPPGSKYVFSDVEYTAGQFPHFVLKIKNIIKEILKPVYGHDSVDFNYCVCNCYQNGLAGVNWHTDAEPHLKPNCPIACVSFGSERVFSLARIRYGNAAEVKPDLNIRLETGSLVVMAGECQKNYLHAISKESSVDTPRFSLTFRVNYIDR
jgi:alkylated DNA repair dioxygenase AlkB